MASDDITTYIYSKEECYKEYMDFFAKAVEKSKKYPNAVYLHIASGPLDLKLINKMKNVIKDKLKGYSQHYHQKAEFYEFEPSAYFCNDKRVNIWLSDLPFHTKWAAIEPLIGGDDVELLLTSADLTYASLEPPTAEDITDLDQPTTGEGSGPFHVSMVKITLPRAVFYTNFVFGMRRLCHRYKYNKDWQLVEEHTDRQIAPIDLQYAANCARREIDAKIDHFLKCVTEKVKADTSKDLYIVWIVTPFQSDDIENRVREGLKDVSDTSKYNWEIKTLKHENEPRFNCEFLAFVPPGNITKVNILMTPGILNKIRQGLGDLTWMIDREITRSEWHKMAATLNLQHNT